MHLVGQCPLDLRASIQEDELCCAPTRSNEKPTNLGRHEVLTEPLFLSQLMMAFMLAPLHDPQSSQHEAT